MRTIVALALVVAVAGCGTPGPQTPEQACASQANDDPQVKFLIMKGTGNTTFQEESQDALKRARQEATLTCLRGRGLVRPGGVERQKPLS